MCEAAALAVSVLLAAAAPAATPAGALGEPAAATAPISVAAEPLYADIIARAKALRSEVESYRTAELQQAVAAAELAGLDGFRGRIGQLAALDMQGHLDLKARNVDGDLKCILKGIAEDLPKRLADLDAAKTGSEQDRALSEMRYLLNDNVEVLLAPPQPPV
jgi:hypothetical protein